MSKPESWGKRLSAVLKEKGLSQKEAAKIAGVQPSVLSGWIAGVSPQDFMSVKKLSDYLEISFAWLLSGTTDKSERLSTVSELFEEVAMFDGYLKVRIDRLVPRKKE